MLGYCLCNFFCFHGVFELLTYKNSSFILIIVLHHVQCFLISSFSLFYVQTIDYERAMCSLEK